MADEKTTDAPETTAAEKPAEGGSSEAAAAPVIENETPVSADAPISEELQSDLQSRYGDVLPDVIQDLMPQETPVVAKTEGGEKTDPQPNDGTAPSADGGQPAQPATTTTQPEGGVQPDELAQAKVMIANLQNLVQSQAAPVQTPAAQPGGEQQPVNPLEVIPDYDFDMPDQLVTMLASEDPVERKQALNSLTKGIAQTVHQQTMKTVAGVITQMQTDIPNATMQQFQQQQLQSQVAGDFYGKFPNLNNDAIKPSVRQVAEQLMKSDLLLGIQPAWTPAFMDRVAAGVNALFGQPIPETPAPATPPVDPPASFGGANGGGAMQANTLAKGVTTQQDHINSLFDT